jgi:hypothetical protein
MQRFIIPVVVAIVLIAGQAYLQGIWTERWSQHDVSAEITAFAERMNHIPTSFGDWESVDSPISQRELEASGSVNSYSRRFTNRKDPAKIVDIFLVCGHPRDITAHTPDQCYVLSGFQETEDAQTYSIDTGDKGKMSADFMTNRFRKSFSIVPQDLRIFWTFSGDGEWVSPSVPKYSLSHFPAMYKLYANTSLYGESRTRPEDSAAVPFLREFMPVLNKALFPPELKSGNGAAKSGDASSGTDSKADSADSKTVAPAATEKSPQ